MAPQELILSACSSDPSSSSARQQAAPSIHLHDLLSSAPVQQFKTSSSSAHSLGHVQTQNGQGGGIFAVQEGKAMLNMWAWQKDQMHSKLHLPEKLTCFTVSPNGFWAVGGSPNGQVYLWELASGLLLASFTAHYRAVTSLSFTSDSHLLLSTSLDSSTHIFLVSKLVDPEDPATAGKPYGSLTDHTLAVRGVGLGQTAGSAGGRCWTCSDDGTVKLWSLHPPFALLTTFSLPPSSTPTCLAIDPSERFFYVSTTQGDVYHIPLFRRKGGIGSGALESAGMDVDSGYEAVGGGGNGVAPIKTEGAVISIKTPITSLALSISATHLLVGTSEGTIQLYALPSHQHLRTLSPHAGPVAHLSTLLRPVDLVASSSASGAGLVSKADQWPIMEVKAFERMKARSPQHTQEVTIRLQPSSMQARVDGLRPREKRSIGGQKGGDEKAQLEALLAENKKLKTALDKAGKINERMWNGIVDLRLAQSYDDADMS
ncbi:pre-rRNA-processing protein IPI3 [Kwoniella heveanensis CBS 569]|nr:pre-rRNA-processing protein IPI3 [Kwoniella heveanensis CBS 569]